MNVLRGIQLTATRVSSTEGEKKEARRKVEVLARENGYASLEDKPDFWAKSRYKKGCTVFKIPFLSESFTSTIERIVRNSGLPICVVVKHPRTLKNILTSNRLYDKSCVNESCLICANNERGSCKKMGCIYRITCECGEEYIGETGRALSVRIEEHVRGLRNPSRKSYVDMPLAKHRVARHSGNCPSIRVKVLGVSADTVSRKIIEAIWIRKVKPTLNIKREMEESIELLH